MRNFLLFTKGYSEEDKRYFASGVSSWDSFDDCSLSIEVAQINLF